MPDEGRRAARGVDGKDGSLAKEAAEDGAVASTLAGDGNDSHGGRLVVDHADGDLVGDQGGKSFGIGIARNGDHIQADRADGGHGLELGEREVAGLDRASQRGILADGHERTGEPTDAR